jgi:hypothetical protein
MEVLMQTYVQNVTNHRTTAIAEFKYESSKLFIAFKSKREKLLKKIGI